MFGQGITNVWVEQGLQKLGACLRNGSAKMITGFQLRHSLQDLILELPVLTCPLRLPHKLCSPLATSTWLTHLWEFLDQHSIVLQHPFPTVPLQRQHDAFLLEIFVTAGYSRIPLQRLHLCQK
jgi:hypothetical protein